MRLIPALALLSALVAFAAARPAYALCGDGNLEAGEACDDGGIADG
jgi:hypothetical protein